MDLDKLASKTYNRVSRVKDHGAPGPSPELAAQRAVQDAVLAERHRIFDLKAQDNTMKYERPHFSVVGEGTFTAQEAFRKNYDLIDWSK